MVAETPTRSAVVWNVRTPPDTCVYFDSSDERVFASAAAIRSSTTPVVVPFVSRNDASALLPLKSAILSAYAPTSVPIAVRMSASATPFARPASTKLVASRRRSHVYWPR